MKRLMVFASILIAAHVASAQVWRSGLALVEVSSEWVHVPQSASGTLTFRSPTRRVEVNVLVQAPDQLREDNLERAAHLLLREALRTHEALAEKNGLTPLKLVHAGVRRSQDYWAAEFFGSDNSGREFRHLTIVRPRRSITLYADSDIANQEELARAIGELQAGVRE